MLKVLRNSANSWLIKVLMLILALSFAIWGVGDYVNRQMNQPVVVIDDWELSQQRFAEAYERDFREFKQAMGGNFDKKMADMFGLKQKTLGKYINRYLIKDNAQSLSMAVSPKMLRDRINQSPAFRTNGKFDMKRYDIVLRDHGTSPKEYEFQMSTDLMMQQLEQAMRIVPHVSELDLRGIYDLYYQQRMVEVLSLDPSKLEKAITPDEKSLKDYLEVHQNEFMTPPKVKLRYVVLNAESVRQEITISEDEIQAYYTEYPEEFNTKETRRLRHILRLSDKKNLDAAKEQALLKEAREKIMAGLSFEEAAKQYSEDPSASQGGDLGDVPRGMMVAPFEKAAFALSKGAVSQIVKTQFGWHLIKVEDIAPGGKKSLAEAKAEIRDKILARKSIDAIYKKSEVLEDQIYGSGDLLAMSKDMNLRFKETDFLARGDKKLRGVEKDEKFLSAAFSTKKGELSNLLELSGDRFGVLQVLDTKASRPRTLEEAREELLVLVKQERARTQAMEIMNKALETLDKDGDWEKAATAHAEISRQTSGAFSLRKGDEKLSNHLQKAAFRLQPNQPLIAQVLESETGFHILRLKKTIPADPNGFEKEKLILTQYMQQNLEQEQFASFMLALRSNKEIKYNADVLKQF